MPYSVKSLHNVKKDSRAHAFVSRVFFNDAVIRCTWSIGEWFFLVIQTDALALGVFCNGGFKMLNYQFLKQL
jgi:hypothetical protein